MGKTRAKKIRSNNRNNKRRKLRLKPTNQRQQRALLPGNSVEHQEDPILFGGGQEDSPVPVSSPDQIQPLLESYNKDQLIGFLVDAVAADASFLAHINALADRVICHRKVFVHGLSWDSTRETLLQVFEPYGDIEDCNVVMDKVTGRTKGYGFVIFRTRASAVKALKEPEKKIKNRMTHCQLASIGPPVASCSVGDSFGRKVYISNVHTEATRDSLRAFFSQFGEIEGGPFGFDINTGKSRGFAIFVYKTQEGARKALEEPYKMFEGHQLNCRLAFEQGQKEKAPALAANPAVLASNPTVLASTPTVAAPSLAATPPSVLAAVAAAQNIALYNQNPAAYLALLGQNPLLAAVAPNPAVATAALNPTAGFLASQGQQGAMGIGSGTLAFPGAYGSQALAGLQGLQSYQGALYGQSSSMRPSGSFGRFP
ncbi:UBP1-associated protein 2A-like [Curcuma longa]|uniref:UBP1-associated protein 2A-like n=1 Tax=Curcuma longa TaxID=136217 RepID=UPI003D9EBD78